MPYEEAAGQRRSGSPASRDTRYVRWPSIFWVHHLNATFVHAFDVIDRGKLAPRRIGREHLYQHFFFNSFKSIKTVPWLLQNRPERYVTRPPDYWKYQSVFWNVRNVPNTAALLWARSRPDKAVYSQSEKYRRSMYPSVFIVPTKVPDTSFASHGRGPLRPGFIGPPVFESESEAEWTTTDKPSTTWTPTEQ